MIPEHIKNIKLGTFEDIDIMIPTEKDARNYLSWLRWGEWPKCPKCNNEKSYIINHGERYKCANNQCYYRYSVISNSLLVGSNITLIKWVKAIWVYCMKRGRMDGFEIALLCEVTDKTGLFMNKKLQFGWKYINNELQKEELFYDFIKKMFSLYDQKEELDKVIWPNQYHVSNIDNINDPRQFSRLLEYCNVRLKFCRYWWFKFTTPRDVMSEVYIYLYDNKVKDYDADYIVKIINRTLSRMWYRYKKENPNLNRNMLARNREYAKEQNRLLSKNYILSLAQRKTGKSRTELKMSSDILKEIKENLKQKREKWGRLADFHSHFS